jgi:hypothetical protein
MDGSGTRSAPGLARRSIGWEGVGGRVREAGLFAQMVMSRLENFPRGTPLVYAVCGLAGRIDLSATHIPRSTPSSPQRDLRDED